MLHGHTDSDALMLAAQYDLSGGEIENNLLVNAILSGKYEIDLEEIISTCRHERISQSGRAK